MNRKFCGASMLLLPLALVGCGSNGAVGGPEVTEMRTDSGDFDKVLEAGTAGIYVRAGSPASVKVMGDADAISHVKTTVENGTLIVKTDDNFKPKNKVRVAVVMPHLVDIDLKGTGSVDFQNLDNDPLNMTLDGTGNIGGDGDAKSLTISLSGAGNINLPHLNLSTAKVSIGGTGNVELQATKALDVTITGTGNVIYHGGPKVTSKITGVGTVKPYKLG